MRYSLADISDLMFNRPVAITRQKAEIILGAMGPRLNIASLVVAGEQRIVPIGDLAARAAQERLNIASETMPGDRDYDRQRFDPWTESYADAYEIWNGVAIMKVRGTLVPEGGLNPESGMTSYAGLDYKLRQAIEDDRVLGLAYDIDSGGGAVIDCFELCRSLLAAREKKPIRAIVRGSAASAAYAVASCANEVTSAPYSWSGSIGCIYAHAEFSEAYKQNGIAVTLITSGEHKADASEDIPLSAEARATLQGEVDLCAGLFFDHVAAARGLSVDQIKAQEARFYNGEEARGAGLVDKVMAWDDSLREFAEAVNRRQSPASTASIGTAAGAIRGAARMEHPANTAPAAESQPGITQAQVEEARTTSAAAATTAERERIAQLAELDAESTISLALSAAIEAGTAAGDFAIQLARASKEQKINALADAKADAVQPAQLPEQRTEASSATTKENRGVAAVNRLRGRHKGLPAQV